jgi:tight adherence protein B
VTASAVAIVVAGLGMVATWLFGRGIDQAAADRRLALARGLAKEGETGRSPRSFAPWIAERLGIARTTLLGFGVAVPSALLGLILAGPPGLVAAGIAGAVTPAFVDRRRKRGREGVLEQQLSDFVETSSLALRSGLALPQAVEFAANEADEPIGGLLRRLLDEQRVGTPFDAAVRHFADALGTEDAALFALVVGIHARSGGNLSGALDEVVATIRHRVSVRRELRALSAQGRVSGAVLGSLPILFFVVLAATSRRDLMPVYRSPAGIGMVSGGLLMEALAYVWIRRLMKVEL